MLLWSMDATEWASRFELMLKAQKQDPLDFDGHIKRLATEPSACTTWNEFQTSQCAIQSDPSIPRGEVRRLWLYRGSLGAASN